MIFLVNDTVWQYLLFSLDDVISESLGVFVTIPCCNVYIYYICILTTIRVML